MLSPAFSCCCSCHFQRQSQPYLKMPIETTACALERWEGHGSRGAHSQGCLLLPRGFSPFPSLRRRFVPRNVTLPEATSLLDAPQSQSKRETGQRWRCERDSESQACLTPPRNGGGNVTGWLWELAARWQESTWLKHLFQKRPAFLRAAFLLITVK